MLHKVSLSNQGEICRTNMTFSMLLIGVVVSALGSWLAVRWLITYLVKNNVVDHPNERTMHVGAVPRGGGLVIVFCLQLALLGAAVFSDRPGLFIGLSVSLLLWSGLSWWDDKKDLTPKARFVAQSVFSVLAVAAFGWVNSIQLADQLWLNLSIFGAVLTVLGILWMANLYNFMDGMDGLAASQTIIASVTLSFWFWQAGDQVLAFVCAVLAASSYGFLLWNWRPAKIFMGDVGSISLGAFFATLLLVGATRYDFPVVSFLLLFAVFIVDASVTLLRRVYRREKFWLAHRTHYYQRLANIGVSQVRIVISAVILMLLCSLIASISLAYRDIIIPAILLILGIMLCAAIIVVRLERTALKINKNNQ